MKLNNYLNTMKDPKLYEREKDLLEEMEDTINKEEAARYERVQGLDRRLNDLEDERENNLVFLCDALRK